MVFFLIKVGLDQTSRNDDFWRNNLLVKGSVCCSAQAGVENPVFDTTVVLEFILLISLMCWTLMSSFDQFIWCLSWISVSWFNTKGKWRGGHRTLVLIYFLSFVIFSLFEISLSKFSHQKRRGERREHEDANRVTVKSTREGGWARFCFLEFTRQFLWLNCVTNEGNIDNIDENVNYILWVLSPKIGRSLEID